MSRAESLYRLQLLDLEIDRARKRQREIEAAIGSNAAFSHAQTEWSAAQKVAHAAASELKLLELDAQTLDEKIRSDEQRLYDGKIKNPKELLDVERDLAHLRKRRAELDERVLDAMLASDDARQTERNCEAAVRQARAKWDEDTLMLRAEMASLNDQIVAEGERRAAAVVAIPRADLDLYANLRARKNGLAVAVIKGAACSVCGEAPSSKQLQEARVGDGVVMCATCGRILYGA